MTQIDKYHLQNLKTTFLQLNADKPAMLSQIMSELDLSLTSETILIYRNLNELFLCVNTHKSVDMGYFTDIKGNLLNQIDLMLNQVSA